MEDLLAEFVAESREMLEALGGEIVAWEADPGDRSRLASIFRFVHTVKGNCGFFDLPRLQALSHAAEDALADVRAGRRQGDAALVSAVLAVIDRIGDMVDAIDAGVALPDDGDEGLIRALEPQVGGEESEVLAPEFTASAKSVIVQRSVRLPVDLLDRVMSGVSDMVLARNDLARRLREGPIDASIEGPFERLSAIIGNVRDAMTRTRMQRIDTLFAAMPRLVRDLSAELGKQVMVDMEGGDVELDREMIETVRDPLIHIIRNAIDHGIEPSAERLAAGKREIGLLTLSARQSGNQIMIDVVDNGRGIDADRLVDKAIATGLIEPADGARMQTQERLGLIFEPGLSTAEAVTAISGRGVGMDVVRANIERVGGAVELDSTPGLGTRLTIRVPLTLSIIPALTIGLAGQRFAIPRSAIEEIVHASEEAIELTQLATTTLAKVRGRRLPCLALGDILQVPGGADSLSARLIVLRLAGGDLFALSVDELHDHEDLVVKPIAPAIMATGLYAGTTLTDDGTPILLLDVAGLARVGGLSFDAHERGVRLSGAVNPTSALGDKVLLFNGVDGHRRAIRMAVVSRVEEVERNALQFGSAGAKAMIDGRLLPLAGAAQRDIPEGTVRLFRLSDGTHEIAYALDRVADIARIEGEIVPALTPGEIEGLTLIGGEPVQIVDAHWLFARFATEPSARQPVCRLAGDDPWLHNFLRPLAEAAGYRVVGDRDQGHADLAIGDQDDAAEARETIRLRASREETNEGPGSVYRYDREALTAAFAAARRRIAS